MKRFVIHLFLSLALCNTALGQKRYHGDGIDEVLRVVPYAAIYGLKASGIESDSGWGRLVVNTAGSFIISSGATWVLKKSINKERPDGTDFDAFPSGHTAHVFAGAHALHKEYHHVSPWISVGGYAVATLTAADRIRRNRHDWRDVLTGAAIGIVSTEAAYWIGDKITGYHSRFHIGLGPSEVSLLVQL